MRSGRSAAGVVTGVLLGLGVIALASSGFNPFMTRVATSSPTSEPGAVTTVLTPGISQGSQNNLYQARNAATAYSNLDALAKKPTTDIGLVLLPIIAALLLGFVVFRMSKVRSHEKEFPEAT